MSAAKLNSLFLILVFIFVTSVWGQPPPPPGVSPCSYATRYVCNDILDTDSVCMVIFNGSNPSNGTVDPKCLNATYLATAQQCAYTCADCCQTPAYDCQNAAPPNPFDCAVLTQAQCKDPKSQQELALYCPATCGLCNVGGCTDAIDCTGLEGGCLDQNLTTFMHQQCARTCGFCSSSTPLPGVPGGGTCVDIATNCAQNSNLCNDATYKALMAQQCAATCGVCSGGGTGGGSCTDANANCGSWATNGFCSSTYYTTAQKQQYCAKTCNLCTGK